MTLSIIAVDGFDRLATGFFAAADAKQAADGGDNPGDHRNQHHQEHKYLNRETREGIGIALGGCDDFIQRGEIEHAAGNAGKKMGDYVIDHGDEQIEHDDVLGCATADGALLRQKHLAAVGNLHRGDDGTKGGIFDAVLKHRR